MLLVDLFTQSDGADGSSMVMVKSFLGNKILIFDSAIYLPINVK